MQLWKNVYWFLNSCFSCVNFSNLAIGFWRWHNHLSKLDIITHLTLNGGIYPSTIKNGQTLNSLHIHVLFLFCVSFSWGFPGGSEGEVSACSAGDLGSIPGSGGSPGEGNGSPVQRSCLENPRTAEPGGCSPRGRRAGRDWATPLSLSLSYCCVCHEPWPLCSDQKTV